LRNGRPGARTHASKIKLRMLTDGAPPALPQSAWRFRPCGCLTLDEIEGVALADITIDFDETGWGCTAIRADPRCLRRIRQDQCRHLRHLELREGWWMDDGGDIDAYR
jgi:hypothetical protein